MDITDAEWRTLHTIARESKRRYPMVEEDDVVQELALWMLAHEDHIEKWREDEYGYKARYVALKRAAYAICEKEKAFQSGYQPEDVHFYSINQIKDLLPLVFEGATGVVSAADEKVFSGRGDPATGGDLLTMVIDVEAALLRVTPAMRQTLYDATQTNFDYQLMATEADKPYHTVYRRVRRALAAVQKELGGPNPHKEFTGQRKAMSNAQARAVLRNQETRR